MEDTKTFEMSTNHRRDLPLYGVIFLGTAIWLCIGFPDAFGDYDDWRKWLILAMGLFVIICLISGSWCSLISTFGTLTIAPNCILKKTRFRKVEIPWESVLRVQVMYQGTAYRIVGTRRNLIFNAEDYDGTNAIIEMMQNKMSEIIDPEGKSDTDEVLAYKIKLILRDFPDASVIKVFGKLEKEKGIWGYEKVKVVLESTRMNKPVFEGGGELENIEE